MSGPSAINHRQSGILVAATLLSLLPFVGKAVHIDDPLFVWTAQHILDQPLDFYGFGVNWYGWTQPMHEVTQNPPLTCYYLALAGALFGFSEPALHLAMMVWAVAAVLGMYELAKTLRSPPMLSALILLFSPGFLNSATTLMGDVMMLALWLWAVVLWRWGLGGQGAKPPFGSVLDPEASDRREPQGRRQAAVGRWYLAGAMVCVAATGLTKYFGVALLPLLLMDGWLQRGRLGGWLWPLAGVAAVWAGFEWVGHRLYGHGFFFQAAGYAVVAGDAWESRSARLLTAIAFAGASAIALLLYVPVLWRWRGGLVAMLVAAACLLLAGERFLREDGQVNWAAALQFALAVTALAAGAAMVWLGWSGFSRGDRWLLLLWAVGTLAFAGGLNWTANVRSVLPLLPVAAIVLAAAIDWGSRSGLARVIPLALSAVVALSVAYGDYTAARAAREAAGALTQRYPPAEQPLYFQGHWGFQYYMQRHGATAMDINIHALRPGDLMVVPRDNTNTEMLPLSAAPVEGALRMRGASWIAVMSRDAGAGFYSSIWGPLPYVFGPAPPQQYVVQRLTHHVRAGPPAAIPRSAGPR